MIHTGVTMPIQTAQKDHDMKHTLRHHRFPYRLCAITLLLLCLSAQLQGCGPVQGEPAAALTEDRGGAADQPEDPQSGTGSSEKTSAPEDDTLSGEISKSESDTPSEEISTSESDTPSGEVSASEDGTLSEETSEDEDSPEEYDITCMALGDNLMHMGIIKTGLKEDGSCDFSFLFSTITDYLDRADIRMINQETVLAGNERGFSGFPRFNSPTEVGDAIADAGFNVVLHASNHTADQGCDGLISCAEFWENEHPEVLLTGITAEDRQSGESADGNIPLLTVKDVTFAILNYTYGPNAEILDQSLMGRLNMLCAYDPQSGRIDFTSLNPGVISDIKEAKQKADIVIVCPHWGTEYTASPSQYQRSFAAEMAEAGADLIIGTHPHVPQPIEWITSQDGRRTLCYYSLGNYASTQKQTICMLEEMAWIRFHVSEDGVSIDEDASGALPLVCHYTSGPVRFEGVYPLEDYTEEMAEAHGIRDYGGVILRLDELQQKAQEILGDMALSKSDILNP